MQLSNWGHGLLCRAQNVLEYYCLNIYCLGNILGIVKVFSRKIDVGVLQCKELNIYTILANM